MGEIEKGDFTDGVIHMQMPRILWDGRYYARKKEAVGAVSFWFDRGLERTRGESGGLERTRGDSGGVGGLRVAAGSPMPTDVGLRLPAVVAKFMFCGEEAFYVFLSG